VKVEKRESRGRCTDIEDKGVKNRDTGQTHSERCQRRDEPVLSKMVVSPSPSCERKEE
jgi:hypothetical protein